MENKNEIIRPRDSPASSCLCWAAHDQFMAVIQTRDLFVNSASRIVSFTGKEIDASIRWVLGVAQSMRSGGSRMGSDGLLDGRCSMKTGPIECIEGSLVVSGQSRDCFLSCGRGAPPVHHRPDPGPGGPCGPSPACATGWILSPGRYGGCFTSHIRKKAREHAFLKLVAKAGSRPLELGGSATTLAPLH